MIFFVQENFLKSSNNYRCAFIPINALGSFPLGVEVTWSAWQSKVWGLSPGRALFYFSINEIEFFSGEI